ncbi:UNKNOWN [Stylonychia lemnae]|uniref:Uncharacterized protein n=1 Tax=Stylonychia lemnae TaxID=5949 RepID=A0A078A7T8_STYLE|nr:UNKNOWN [Stylonychia lemnae]|eukprot:CDW78325.1 UNKNOWN [Stylonychia lemnae]
MYTLLYDSYLLEQWITLGSNYYYSEFWRNLNNSQIPSQRNSHLLDQKTNNKSSNLYHPNNEQNSISQNIYHSADKHDIRSLSNKSKSNLGHQIIIAGDDNLIQKFSFNSSNSQQSKTRKARYRQTLMTFLQITKYSKNCNLNPALVKVKVVLLSSPLGKYIKTDGRRALNKQTVEYQQDLKRHLPENVTKISERQDEESPLRGTTSRQIVTQTGRESRPKFIRSSGSQTNHSFEVRSNQRMNSSSIKQRLNTSQNVTRKPIHPKTSVFMQSNPYQSIQNQISKGRKLILNMHQNYDHIEQLKALENIISKIKD